MTTISLYEIGAEFAALEAALTESGGELTPEVEAAWDALGQLEARKLDAYRQVSIRFEYHAKACQAEIDVLTAKANASLNAAKRLKERLKLYMESRGVTELKGDLFAAKLQRNGGKPPLVLLVPVEELPPELTRTRVEPDLDKIREHVAVVTDAMGEPVSVFARIDPVGTHLRWR